MRCSRVTRAAALLALTTFWSASPRAAAEEPAREPTAAAAEVRVTLGELTPNISCLGDPSQTYTLYLPTSYSAEFPRPVLFIFDPRGRSVMAAEIFRDAAERYGWILMSSDNTRSDGPWEPNFKAVRAMGPDVARYAFDKDRVYATGFSGGAMLAWIWAQQTRGVAGVISSGGRPVKPASEETEVPFAHFGAAGEGEFNYLPTRELDQIAERLGAPHRFESFPGPHAWMPAELGGEAIEWMEVQAMRSGTRPIDETLVAELYEKDLARARELEEAGELLKAMRRYQAVVRTFEGLHDTRAAADRVARLANSPELERALSEEKSAHAYERAQLHQMARAVSRFRARPGETDSREVMSASELEIELRLPLLLATAEKDNATGLAAQRVLNSMAAQLGFYMPQDYFQARDYARAAVVLELAAKIGPPRSWVLYNLASAQAQLGKRKKAMSALTRAVEAGYSQADHMEQDPDLEPLRKLSEFQELLARLKARATPDAAGAER